MDFAKALVNVGMVIIKAGMIFEDFEEMLNKAAKDCDYIHLYDKKWSSLLKVFTS